MNRILRIIIIIFLAFISHTPLFCAPSCGGIRGPYEANVVVRHHEGLELTIRPELQVGAPEPRFHTQQREPEQTGCFLAFRQALNNRMRRLLTRPSLNQITPISNPVQPVSIITSTPAASSSTEQNAHTCSICLDGIETTQTSRALLCAHTFHAPCVNTWLENNSTCPICRATVDPAREARESNQNSSTADHEDTRTPWRRQIYHGD